jgi:hypothetical protein
MSAGWRAVAAGARPLAATAGQSRKLSSDEFTKNAPVARAERRRAVLPEALACFGCLRLNDGRHLVAAAAAPRPGRR